MTKNTKNIDSLQINIDKGHRIGLMKATINLVIESSSQFTALAMANPEDLKHQDVVIQLALLMLSANVSYLLTCAKQVVDGSNRAQVEHIAEPLPGKVLEQHLKDTVAMLQKRKP